MGSGFRVMEMGCGSRLTSRRTSLHFVKDQAFTKDGAAKLGQVIWLISGPRLMALVPDERSSKVVVTAWLQKGAIQW